MTLPRLLVSMCVLLMTVATQSDDAAKPRTGFFTLTLTPVEVLGEAGAQGVADVLPLDQPIEWQLYVPHNYSAASPPGAIVYVSPWESGASPKEWNELLAAKNLIWIGANNAGNEFPVSERMLKAILAPTVLRQSYVIDPERTYVAGFSGGGITATRIAAAMPELFKGGAYMGGTVFWEDVTPPKVDMIRQNRHVFMVGTYDPALRTTKRVQKSYKDAGVEHTRLITIRNHKHRLPPMDYFARAVDYLDSGSAE